MTAVLKDSAGNTLTGRVVRWRSANPVIARKFANLTRRQREVAGGR